MIAALGDGAEEVDRKRDPDDGDRDVYADCSFRVPRLWLMPRGSVIAADTMIACQPQKWNWLSLSLNMRALSRRCDE
ncbi:MAG: hypothetical protein R3B07_30270 [Polyangiaceae bacterium]